VPKKLIIAATSARGYAKAAVACGYEVITLDAFADADTRQVATQTFKLKVGEHGIDEDDFKHIFLQTIEQINIDDIKGFLYGGLFDATPYLLDWIAARVPLIGNAAEVMRIAKDFGFFKVLDTLKIVHPEVRMESPEDTSSWLSKKLGASGGAHIKPANQANNGDYFQRKLTGTPISILFVADGKSARTIGFNQQFVAPMDNMPYRFAGAVSGVTLPHNILVDFEHAAQQLTTTLNLRGINSLDAILEGETLWILELNPRLSATFHLYENLFSLHMQGCAGSAGSVAAFLPTNKSSRAQFILYADDALEVLSDFVWPDWVADIPAIASKASSVKITQNEPVCTVFAEAEKADTAHMLVLQRAQKLREMLNYD
jgi:predicted ATP-grasp superfamily ATP-dependent carboligase